MRSVDRALLLIIIFIQFTISCGPSQKGIFSDKRSQHHKYGDRIKEAGLDKTEMGNLWFVAADKSLAEPFSITLPYKENGYFAADKPSAAGYAFDARRGDRLFITVTILPVTVKYIFTELWEYNVNPVESELIASADSTMQLQHDVNRDGRFILRLQPELLQGVEYTVTIKTGPSLAFPVSKEGSPKLISFWSDPRDNGRRSHEGVDISAKFRTPVIASADGRVHRVMQNRLGGKVVFMRPAGKNYTLYYAHLDTQTVNTGDNVQMGQVLGLVGNTGNAVGTVPHLHFGIYSSGGAVDPLPFIDERRKEPEEIIAATDRLNKWMRTTQNTPLAASPISAKIPETVFEIKRGSAILVTGAVGNAHKVQLPDGRKGFVNSKSITESLLTSSEADTLTKLLDNPLLTSAAIRQIEPGEPIGVIGTYGEFRLVRSGNDVGWIE